MPREMSDTMHEVILTHYLNPTDITHSCYSKITELEWCAKEVERLVSKGRNCDLAFSDSGTVAVREWIPDGKWDNFVVGGKETLDK